MRRQSFLAWIDQAHNGAPFGVVGWSEQVDGFAFSTGTGRTANAVNVVFRTLRQVIVDDVFDVRNIKTARGNVGCHENAVFLGTEILNDAVAAALFEIAVDCISRMIGAGQTVSKAVTAMFRFHENDDRASTLRNLRDEVGVFLTFRSLDQFLFDVRRRNRGRANRDTGRVGQVTRRKFSDFGRNGRREQHGLAALGRNVFEDRIDLNAKAHVEHTVGLIENEELGLVQFQRATV